MIELGELELSDVGPLKHVELPLRRQGLVLLRGENRDTTSADSNGVGKSWVLKGLSWVGFGNTVDGERTDEVIRRGALKAVGRFSILEPSGARWDVIRMRSKGGVKVELHLDGKPQTGAIVKDTQATINKLLGMDFQTFRNTVMFGQGDNARFAAFDAPEVERKTVLKNIMRLAVIDKASKIVADRFRTQQARQVVVQRSIDIAEAKLSNISTERIDADIKTLKERKLELSKDFGKVVKLQQLEEKIAKLLEGYTLKKQEITAKQAEREKLNKQRADILGRVRNEQYKVTEKQKQMDLFKGGSCPVCTTPASGKHVVEHLKLVKQERDAAATRAKQLEDEAGQLSVNAAEVTAGIGELQADVADESTWREQQAELRQSLKAIGQNKLAVTQIDGDIASKTTQRSEVAKTVKALNGEMKKAHEEIDQIEMDLRHYAFWQRGFGNQGLPSYVIDNMVPDLNRQTNFWLNILTDGDISVEFDTQSKLKSGEMRDRFAMNTTIEGVEGTRPSGGQGQKIMIASSLGLADVVAEQEAAGLDLACLDEILDGLDAKGKARVTDLLIELRKKRSTVLVVSHDPEITEMFEKVVTLVKEGSATVVA